ncbi:MAG TPA: EF-hand domain-containing protein [Novosphingobium sp.]|nr:EF-hand domain-containing protein [Novosphingobium sp.]
MSRLVLGAVAALLFLAAGLFWVQGRAEVESAAPPPEPATPTDGPAPLPCADVTGLRGPAPPVATELSREQRRFARFDRDSDKRITRNELMSSRTAAFRKLDKDGNNLLTFEEWAVATGDRFRTADANGDLWLSPAEFATTKPKPVPKPKCAC